MALGHQVCPAQVHGQHRHLQPRSLLCLVDGCCGGSLPAAWCCRQDFPTMWTRAGKLALLLKAHQQQRAGGGSKRERQRKEEGEVWGGQGNHVPPRHLGQRTPHPTWARPFWSATLSISHPRSSPLACPPQPTPGARSDPAWTRGRCSSSLAF